MTHSFKNKQTLCGVCINVLWYYGC